MIDLRLGRHALGGGLFVILLAGCGGSQATNMSGATPPGVLTQSRSHHASSGVPLMYAFGSFSSGNGLIMDYPSGQIENSLTVPFGFPSSTCSDSYGNVFVGGQNSSTALPFMVEYAYGATTPSTSLTIGTSAGNIRGCSIDMTTGNVAALIQYDSFTFAVAILPGFTGTPELYTDAGIYQFLSVGYDGKGNLFLGGYNSGKSVYSLAELPTGGSSFGSISLSLPPNATQLKTVQWDGTYVTIEGAYKTKGKPKAWPQAVFQLSISGSQAKVANTIILRRSEPIGSNRIQVVRLYRASTRSCW